MKVAGDDNQKKNDSANNHHCRASFLLALDEKRHRADNKTPTGKKNGDSYV